MNDLLTSSARDCYNTCNKKYYFSYVLRWRSCLPKEAREFGSILHKCWEHYWLARKDGVEGEERMFRSLAQLPEESEFFDAYKRARAEAMVIGYCSVWDRVTDIEVVAVEKQFRLPLINPATGARSRTWDLGGKLDVVVRKEGRLCVIEHKSSGESFEEGSTYRLRLIMDGQMSQYFEGGDQAARDLGFNEPIDRIIYDASFKPKLKPYKATPEEDRIYTKEKSKACPECKKVRNAVPPPHFYDNGETQCVDGRIVTDPGGRLRANQRAEDESPDEFFDRITENIRENIDKYFQQWDVTRLQSQREEYLWDVWQTGENIREARKNNRFPKNPKNCFQYNTPCDYWDVCTGVKRIDDTRFFRKAERENEELETEVVKSP
jgi:hypothetical protein